MKNRQHRIFSKIILLFCFVFIVFSGFGQRKPEKISQEFFDDGMRLVRKYFYSDGEWHVTNSAMGNSVKGLVDFVSNEPVDSILARINNGLADPGYNFVYRLPEKVADSLSVPGFFPSEKVAGKIARIHQQLRADFKRRNITLPDERLKDMDKRAGIIPPGEGYRLFARKKYTLPDSLVIPEVIPDSMLKSHDAFQRLIRLEEQRKLYIEQKRKFYNDSVSVVYHDSLLSVYRDELYLAELNYRVKFLKDSVVLNNYQVLRVYNDKKIKQVNDSLALFLNVLTEYANYIDSVKLNIQNISNQSEEITLHDDGEHFTRIWIKNAQNDSLSVLVKNVDKRSLLLFIDDGATINRFSKKETKEFDFSTLSRKSTDITSFGKSYELVTPWRIGGDGTIGFTQTYLENWKKGGKSALSQLIVLKGFANYSRRDGKIKWETQGEFRNGWIKQGGEESEFQKNDDKIELTSRFGIITTSKSKWYYSAEFNFETQFFNGYNYPKATNPKPISAFMSPSRTFFKVGLDYKPSPNFSVLLSPFTLKNVYVRDTVKVDATKYGIAKGSKRFWEPGLNADLYLKKEFTKGISCETKYKMFINFSEPLKKYDISWENLVIMHLNRFIDCRLMLHLIYDDDVLFPVYDANNVKIGEKPKLQLKQLTTIGFSYKINHKVVYTRKIR